MGDNLKTAVIQLALCYGSFDKDSACSEEWKEIFVSRFIQNTRSSFDYLDMVSGKNNGQISVDELNYIQYSLTGVELDFSSFAGDRLDRYDAASPLNYGSITGYDYEYTDQGGFPFEFSYSEDDLLYGHFVYVDMTKAPELAEFVRKNAGGDFKITFIWNGEEMERIERVMPVDITLDDKEWLRK